MRRSLALALTAGLILAGAAAAWVREVAEALPDAAPILDYAPRRGQVFVAVKAMPERVVDAFLAAEDGDFYRHGAIDLPMTARALGLDVLRLASGRRPFGGSTITQQLVKNLIVGDDVSLTRKLQEALLAMRIERRLSKDRILEIYLNQVYLGCRAHGVGEAALAYFGKPVTELSIDEAATLGGLPKGPSAFDPARHPAAARRRRNWVVDRMVEDGFLGAELAPALKAAPIRLDANRCRQTNPGAAALPHAPA